MFKISQYTALAALLVTPGAALADAALWQGFYFGGSLGAGQSSFSVTPSFDADGMSLGAFGGYNFAIGENVVLGGELNVIPMGATDGGVPGQSDIEDVVRLRFRGGYAAGDFLAYGGLGYTEATIGNTGGAPSSITDITGYELFLGAEWAAGDRTFVRAEYSYSDFETEDFYGPDSDAELGVLSFGFGLRF